MRLTKHDAGLLAKTIETYWHERGARHVRAWREEIPGFDGTDWQVRSNLVAGLPPVKQGGGRMILLDGKRIPRRLIPAHCEFSDTRARKARAVLRRNLKTCPNWRTEDLDADVIIEQVWNAMTGLDRPVVR